MRKDVKPQNVLITCATNGLGDIKLAHVGLALRLAANRSSYTAFTIPDEGASIGRYDSGLGTSLLPLVFYNRHIA